MINIRRMLEKQPIAGVAVGNSDNKFMFCIHGYSQGPDHYNYLSMIIIILSLKDKFCSYTS